MSNTSTRILKAAGLLACTSLVAVGISMSPGAVTPAMAVECVDVNGDTTAFDDDNRENTACGRSSRALDGVAPDGGKSSAYGFQADALAERSVAIGSFSQVDNRSLQGIAIGDGARVFNESSVDGSESAIAIGNGADAKGDFAIGLGDTTEATADRAIAIGKVARAKNEQSIAIGSGSLADGDHAVALGRSSEATATDSLALGRSANAGHFMSSAIGTFATTTTDHQMVYGTSTETHRMAGITSDLSKSRQSGPLEVVTSDSGGNLATDGGQIFGGIQQNSLDIERNRKDIKENSEGVAVGIALSDPDLYAGKTIAVKGNWGIFEGSNALGVSAKTLVAENLFGLGQLTASGGVGWGLDENTVGGRVSGQMAW